MYFSVKELEKYFILFYFFLILSLTVPVVRIHTSRSWYWVKVPLCSWSQSPFCLWAKHLIQWTAATADETGSEEAVWNVCQDVRVKAGQNWLTDWEHMHSVSQSWPQSRSSKKTHMLLTQHLQSHQSHVLPQFTDNERLSLWFTLTKPQTCFYDSSYPSLW